MVHWQRFGVGVFLVSLLFVATVSAAQDFPVVLEADQLDWDSTQQILRGVGNTRLVYQGNEVYADQVTYDLATSEVTANGQVRWQGPDGEGHAHAITLDTQTKTGVFIATTMEDASGTKAWGEKIERLGPETYLIHNGGFTPCHCDPQLTPTWRITASKAKIKWRKSVAFVNGAFWLNNTPVFYLPAGYLPLTQKRSSGLLFPTLGRSERYGFEIKPGVFIAMGRSADLTLWGHYTSQGGGGIAAELRGRTRFGQEKAYFSWFKEKPGAPYLKLENRSASRRWELKVSVSEQPYNLFRISSDIKILSDRQLERDFVEDAESIADLTQNTASSNISISREFSRWGSVIGRLAISQALLNTSTTGSRFPQLWLRTGALQWPGIPIWLSADFRYDKFASYNDQLGEVWQPRGYLDEGERFMFGVRAGAQFDPLPGLHSRTIAGVYYNIRHRQINTLSITPTATEVNSQVLDVTNTTVGYIDHRTYWSLIFRSAKTITFFQPTLDFRHVFAPTVGRPGAIEDIDSIVSSTWLIPAIQISGAFAKNGSWDYAQRYPMNIANGDIAKPDFAIHEFALKSPWISALGRTWLAKDIPKLKRLDTEVVAKPYQGHQITLGYARLTTDVASYRWDETRPGPFVDNLIFPTAYHEIYGTYRWEILHFFGEFTLRWRLNYKNIDNAGWAERSFRVGYRDKCDCLTVSLSHKNLPGKTADRTTLQFDFALIGSASFEP